ncbi:MAG: DUF3109 family protein [Raineya sp.]|nr:DUF3109 family protein [Raineya sp.]MDW8297064.1 DUF3109 family protein [Raineya sp.]
MLIVENTYISDDIAEYYFQCDLERCKGVCCEAGDLGAPLEENELPIIEQIFEKVKPFMSEKGREIAEKQGLYILDSDGDFSTTTVEGKECVFAIRNEKGYWSCSIEKAYQMGEIDFQKPISCHLYPIRITKYDAYEALNYHQWEVCSPACVLGQRRQVRVFEFLKEPLIRKYGKDWYTKLEQEVTEWEKRRILR